MACRLVFVTVGLLAAGARAYAPIHCATFPTRGLVLKLSGSPANVGNVAPPARLIVGNTADDTSGITPHFSAKLDQTIAWNNWCIEAENGAKRGAAVYVNRCTGSPSQKWTWVPDEHGRNMIQLMDSSMCLDVVEMNADLNGAPVALEECANGASDLWTFEEPLRLPTRSLGHAFLVGRVVVSLLAFAGLGALILSSSTCPRLLKPTSGARTSLTSQKGFPFPVTAGRVGGISNSAKKGKSNKRKGAGAPAGGFGFGRLPTVGDAKVDSAIALCCDSLKKNKNDAETWMDLGIHLVNANEHAEAARVFRTGATHCPEHEKLKWCDHTSSGYSAAFCRDGYLPSELPSEFDMKKIMSDDNYEAYEAPSDHIFADENQQDRHIDWHHPLADVRNRGVVFVSKAPLLDPAECAWVIEQAEAHAAIHGWTSDRHVYAATMDHPVEDIPAIRDWFDKQLTKTIFPAVAARYPHAVPSHQDVRVHEAFVVKYDAEKQPSLPMHTDSNQISLTIALNDRSEYEGGGACFEKIRPVGASKMEIINGKYVETEEGKFQFTALNADTGGCVIFPGKLRHGGNAVTCGQRYIITLFLYVDANGLTGDNRPKKGYVLRHLGYRD